VGLSAQQNHELEQIGQLEAPRGRRGEFYCPFGFQRPVKLPPATTWSFQLPHLFQLVVLLRRKANPQLVPWRWLSPYLATGVSRNLVHGLWNLLSGGQISPSEDANKGHKYNKLGALVYCSPCFDTAISYARPQNVFGDGVYHMATLGLRVDMTKRHRGGRRGSMGHNCGNPAGEEDVRLSQVRSY